MFRNIVNFDKGFANIVAVIIALVVLAGAGAGYFVMKRQKEMIPTQAGSALSEPVDSCEDKTYIKYPQGGEVFNLNEPVNIEYCLSSSLKNELTENELVELYLVDSQNTLVGNIGKVERDASNFIFNITNLAHSGGLDFYFKAPPTGEYKIILLARQKAEQGTFAADYGVNSWDGMSVNEVKGFSIDNAISQKFSIEGIKQAQSLQVTSPKSGEFWKIGSTYEIRWDWVGPSGDSVRILLHKKELGEYSFSDFIDYAPADDQLYVFTLNPAGISYYRPLTVGNYKVEVVYDSPFGRLSDVSEPITITE